MLGFLLLGYLAGLLLPSPRALLCAGPCTVHRLPTYTHALADELRGRNARILASASFSLFSSEQSHFLRTSAVRAASITVRVWPCSQAETSRGQRRARTPCVARRHARVDASDGRSHP
eukprot:6200016-Pleurochrysis_carterae.AAC.5